MKSEAINDITSQYQKILEESVGFTVAEAGALISYQDGNRIAALDLNRGIIALREIFPHGDVGVLTLVYVSHRRRTHPSN